MSTTPTDQPQAGGGYGNGQGRTPDLGRLPIPGNAELVVFLLVWLVVALIWLLSDEVGARTFATLTVALTFAYLISRGIAKAGRVVEQ